jgi:hypothetical protein
MRDFQDWNMQMRQTVERGEVGRSQCKGGTAPRLHENKEAASRAGKAQRQRAASD